MNDDVCRYYSFLKLSLVNLIHLREEIMWWTSIFKYYLSPTIVHLRAPMISKTQATICSFAYLRRAIQYH